MSEENVLDLWQKTFHQAVTLNASDLHIEPQSDVARIRVRIDGHLRQLCQYPKTWHDQLCAKIKLEARLDISEKRIPQDGHVHQMAHSLMDCRVATLPTIHGEKITIRLLPNTIDHLHIDNIGLSHTQLSQMKQLLQKDHGLILISGPTGSGKTRTIYSYLHHLNQQSKNICTIEDPAEIQLEGINQLSIHPKSGLTFDVGLKSLLRHDPDILMIGEIRDQTTASIAFQAAQTGHLVFASIHANSALGILARLTHLGISKDLLCDALLALCSQRLVRKLCQVCLGLSHSECECTGSGYQGVIAAHEIIPITDSIRLAIENDNDSSALMRIVRQSGIESLSQRLNDLVSKNLTSAIEIQGMVH